MRKFLYAQAAASMMALLLAAPSMGPEPSWVRQGGPGKRRFGRGHYRDRSAYGPSAIRALAVKNGVGRPPRVTLARRQARA